VRPDDVPEPGQLADPVPIEESPPADEVGGDEEVAPPRAATELLADGDGARAAVVEREHPRRRVRPAEILDALGPGSGHALDQVELLAEPIGGAAVHVGAGPVEAARRAARVDDVVVHQRLRPHRTQRPQARSQPTV
jgi:hypothetical protein